MDTALFDYELPEASIAQTPVSPRDSSRLLVDGPVPSHAHTRDLPDLLGPGDVLVLNDTRVMPARLGLFKATGGAVEVLVLDEIDQDGWWEALVKPSRRVSSGAVLRDGQGRQVLEVGAATGDGTRRVRALGSSMTALLDTLGVVPLPPYITTMLEDVERYQTVYAARPGSVAAPTAGLHFTPVVLERCRAAGAEIVTVDLQVGIGTFRPLTAATIDGHAMHHERYEVASATWDAVQGAERVVAVGTTVVRTLEAVAATGCLAGRTDLFITPGYRFAVVDALVTNFHLPRSSLLVMIEAFIGPRWRDLYQLAIAERYRFLSFGDAMFLQRGGPRP